MARLRLSPVWVWAALGAGCAAPYPASRQPGTVVCVHGFMRGRGNTAAMACALRRDGWRVLNWGYPSRARTIDGHAAALAGELGRLAGAHPGEEISFVTHSLGGLVVRAALNRPDCPAEARRGRVALLAPPNRGSVLARRLSGFPPARWVFGSHAGRELMTSGDFDRLGAFPEGLPVLVLAGDAGWNPWIPGPDDGKVGVGETPLPTPHRLKRVRAWHSWIAWSPSAIRAVRGFLGRPAPASSSVLHP
jgi:pimeloyl-ACP methyl ester carboxylesterase